METYQKNGLLKWDAWQYMFIGDAVKFQANALNATLLKHREAVCREYLANTDRLIASQETIGEIIKGIVNKNSSSSIILNDNSLVLADSFKKGINEVLGSLSYLNEEVCSRLDDITGAINDLNASFNWGINRLVWHLSDIQKTIQMPIDNQALNYRKHGMHAYQNGWFDEALKNFQSALTYYEYDFISHQYLGDIYLYYKKDLRKAWEHFSKTAKYSRTRDAGEKEKKISSWAELHVGLVHYRWNNFEEAVKAAYRALKDNPSAEALYQVGHYLSLGDRRHEKLTDIIKAFEVAIRKDPVYFFKIDQDHNLFEKDLYAVKNEMRALKESLYKEEKEKARQKIEKINKGFASTDWYYNNNTRKILEILEKDIRLAEEMFKNRQSYLDFRIIQEMI